MREVNEPTSAHGNKTRSIFNTEQLMGGGELLRFFGQRSGAKGLILCGYYT